LLENCHARPIFLAFGIIDECMGWQRHCSRRGGHAWCHGLRWDCRVKKISAIKGVLAIKQQFLRLSGMWPAGSHWPDFLSGMASGNGVFLPMMAAGRRGIAIFVTCLSFTVPPPARRCEMQEAPKTWVSGASVFG
jgi:hypothetical protein